MKDRLVRYTCDRCGLRTDVPWQMLETDLPGSGELTDWTRITVERVQHTGITVTSILIDEHLCSDCSTSVLQYLRDKTRVRAFSMTDPRAY